MTQVQMHDQGSAHQLAALAEEHRGFVRAIDQRMAKIYGLGGMPFFVVLAGLPLLALVFGLWTSAMLWVPGVTLALIVLYLGRKAIYERRDRLRAQVETYGQANGVSMASIAAYFQEQDEYAFFAALYEEKGAGAGQRVEPGVDL